MFTGIIEEFGKIDAVKFRQGDKSFKIRCNKVIEDSKLGDSIAVNGICMTITDIGKDFFAADVMNETLLKTTAGAWKFGQQVHLERAMKMGGRLDGHIVQGHVDTIGKLISKRLIAETTYLEISLERKFAELIIPQGSVAINGVSLTVSNLTASSFSVALIPHTLKLTTFDSLKTGDLINLEFDVIGKYILRSNQLREKNNITEEFLIENGF
jgi:riboflavin synthase